jgi:hypothetical protein
MNKIDFLLRKNTFLFKVFNAIILDFFNESEKILVDAVSNGTPMDTIGNLMYVADNGDIRHTRYCSGNNSGVSPYIQRRPNTTISDFNIYPHATVNVHLFPHVRCYWNKCSFCGINHKYHFVNLCERDCSFEIQSKALENLIDNGVSHIWFIDEAFPPSILRKIALFFIEKKSNITWQARCRIESELLDSNLPKMLADSGLRELRLGLESGSLPILKKMSKFDATFSFELVEELCSAYSNCGVSLHFPIIIGFPSESDDDRRLTYDLLTKLSMQYPLCTFNINIFGLDISSKVFQYWVDFDVKSIAFPCMPSHYLGNILRWQDDSINYNSISIQRDQFMRERLYPWMPSHTLTPPHIFYRLSETIRNTLIWKGLELSNSWGENAETESKKYKTSDLTIFYCGDKNLYYIYSWLSHHYMLGNDCVVSLLKIFNEASSILNSLKTLRTHIDSSYSDADFITLINRLITYQYLVDID